MSKVPPDLYWIQFGPKFPSIYWSSHPWTFHLDIHSASMYFRRLGSKNLQSNWNKSNFPWYFRSSRTNFFNSLGIPMVWRHIFWNLLENKKVSSRLTGNSTNLPQGIPIFCGVSVLCNEEAEISFKCYQIETFMQFYSVLRILEQSTHYSVGMIVNSVGLLIQQPLKFISFKILW